MPAPPTVSICDVGPRDGLQNEPDVLAPDVRAELVERLARAGLKAVEVASFVDPRRVPQMAGAEEVVAALERAPGVVYAGLALNERGYERLLAAGLDEVRFAFGATESFNRRNQNATVEGSLQAALRIVERARADGVRAGVTISVAFGCPFEGQVDEGRVLDLAGRVAESRPDTLLLADTMASPSRHRSGGSSGGLQSSGCRSAATSTTPGTRGMRTPSRHSRRERSSSTRRSEVSAAVPSRPGRPGTSRRRTWPTSSAERASRRESTSMRS